MICALVFAVGAGRGVIEKVKVCFGTPGRGHTRPGTHSQSECGVPQTAQVSRSDIGLALDRIDGIEFLDRVTVLLLDPLAVVFERFGYDGWSGERGHLIGI